MKTDAELTRAVAEMFFGLEGVTEPCECDSLDEQKVYHARQLEMTIVRRSDRHIIDCPAPQHINKRYPDPLNDDRDASAVLDKMAEDRWKIVIEHGSLDRGENWTWVVGFSHWHGSWQGMDDSRRRAIVTAALKAKGVEVE